MMVTPGVLEGQDKKSLQDEDESESSASASCVASCVAIEHFHLLTDTQGPARARRDAAVKLLEAVDSPENAQARETTTKLLARALDPEMEEDVWSPVLKAVAYHASPPPSGLAEPMLALSGHVSSGLRPHLAMALGRVMDDELASQLAELAGDEERSPRTRETAVLALGHHRTQQTAGALVSLTQPHHPAAVRQAAFTALDTLTGIARLGADAQAWEQWWQEVRELSEKQWREALVTELGQRTARQRLDQQNLAGRLQEMVRGQYRAADAEQRGPLLAKLLDDPLDPVRELAMTLSVQRLVDNGEFDERLREALRGRLDDPVPEIRQRSALLLRDLADGPAAERAAQILVQRREPAVPALRAKLLLLTRLPRAAAVEPVAELLTHPALRGEAAAMLAAAAEAGVILHTQAQRILERVHEVLAENPLEPPRPQIVRLLGRIGYEPEWHRIAQWLDSEEEAVKRAAAQVWAESNRSLLPLARRMDDPEITALFLHAAIQRADNPAVFEILLDRQPDASGESQMNEQWEQALVAMAGRVPAGAVLIGVERLAGKENEAPLREAMLTAALERIPRIEAENATAQGTANEDAQASSSDPEEADDQHQPVTESPGTPGADTSSVDDTSRRANLFDPTDPRPSRPRLAIAIEDLSHAPGESDSAPGAVEGLTTLDGDVSRVEAALRLARAGIRLEAGRITRALGDLEIVAEMEEALSAEQRRTMTRQRIRAHVLAEDFEQAVTLARAGIEEGLFDEDARESITRVFLDAAHTQIKNGHEEQARLIVSRLGDLLDASPKTPTDETAERLARLEKQIETLEQEPAEPGEPEAPGEDDPDTTADPAEAGETTETTESTDSGESSGNQENGNQ